MRNDAHPLDLLVSGHINVDRFLRLDRFPAADRTVPIRNERVALGGTAATIARVASSYGVSTGLLARIGDGFPPEFLDLLRSARIDLSGVSSVRGEPTPTCYTLEDSRHEQRTLIQQGPMGHPAASLPPSSLLGRYRWLHLTTGNPIYHLALKDAARRRGVRIAVDPAQEIHYLWERGTLRSLLAGAEVLFGNRHEISRAAALVGVRRAEQLVDTVPLVIRTEGKEGAVAFSRGGRSEASAVPPRRVVSLVGSGDAFRGGFYAAWFAGEDLEHCLRAGARAAARWIELGPGPSLSRSGRPRPRRRGR